MSEIPRKPKYKKLDAEDAVFENIPAKAPKGNAKKLRDISFLRDIPIGHLVAFAIEQELAKPKPFDYKYDTSGADQQPDNTYADEALKIYEFLKKFYGGTGIDTIMLCRMDIGIPEKEKVLCGYKELLKSGMVEEVLPLSKTFRYAKDYKFLKIKKGARV